jgi:hypothetical protein
MATDPQPWSPRPKDDVHSAPESFLADLGWAPGGKLHTAAPAVVADAALRRYCSFCWCILPAGAGECADCGHSVAEMEAIQKERSDMDRNWIPPRMWAGAQGAVHVAGVGAGATPVFSNSVVAAHQASLGGAQPGTLSWQHILVAVGIGGFVGGATVAAIWVALQTFGKPASATPGPAAHVTRPSIVLAQAALSWRNPVSELSLELVSNSGVVVADSSNPVAQVRIDPGEYRLRITDNTGRWAPPEEKIIAAPGEVLTVGPPPRVIAGYYLWAGKKLYDQKKFDRAERVWGKSVRHYPEDVEARLQLAALMAVRFRYKEARAQLAEVQRLAPNNSEAIRLSRTLDELEGHR